MDDITVNEYPNELRIRASIFNLQDALSAEISAGNIKEAELPLTHTFTEGVYAREMFLPAGTLVVGKIHKHEHLNFISKGLVDVLTKEGLKRLQGPCTMVSPAGVKRAVYVLEDTIWTTIHANPTNEKDLDKIEDFTIAKTYEELDAIEEAKKLEGVQL